MSFLFVKFGFSGYLRLRNWVII